MCLAEKTDMRSDLDIIVPAMACAVGLILGISASAAYAQNNMVANGSFEAGPVGEGKFTSWGSIGPADNFSNVSMTKPSQRTDWQNRAD